MANRSLAPLPFGIPQLDQLLGYETLTSPAAMPALDVATSLALVGQDGTGKSVFALHLASAYLALWDAARRTADRTAPHHGDGDPPLVFYASSDLRFSAANALWRNFSLDYPWHRYVPFAGIEEIAYRRQRLTDVDPFRVVLAHCVPDKASDSPGAQSVADYLRPGTGACQRPPNVAFLDLASSTTGDDWLFLARLVASVQRRPKAARSLLIVDSVAGFETLVGDRNSFGDDMTRRAKIAQLVRLAAPNWHTVFVVEEPERGTHHPEEYVTDAVIHLRRQGTQERIGRVLEIEKCRARSYGTGEHPFEIRGGFGSSTGDWENPDDPMALLHGQFVGKIVTRDDDGKDATDTRAYHAHVQVFPSLHYLSGQFARSPYSGDKGTRTGKVIGFGVPYLDTLLAKGPTDKGHVTHGLPAGSMTSLIGDEGTLKSKLAEEFLFEGFRHLPAIFRHVYGVASDWIAADDPTGDLFACLRARELSDPEWEFVPWFVKERVKASPGKWFDEQATAAHFENQKREVCTIVAGRKDWILRSREEVKADKVLGPDGTEDSKPLSARRDLLRYVTEPSAAQTLAGHYEASGISTDEQKRVYQAFILALTVLRSSSGFIAPAVFLSTHDTAAHILAERIVERAWSGERGIGRCLHGLFASIADAKARVALEQRCREAVSLVIERFVIVRRLELVDASSQQVWQITRECVTHALHLVGNLPRLAQEPPESHASEVRVVVSDLRLLRDTYPTVADDALFLPTLVFRLRRLGVTGLLVDSDRGRPDQDPTHSMNGALRSLVDHQLYTWKVPFFGEQRVAISAVPPLTPNQLSVIREVKMNAKSVHVDPHFELYSGLERGNPQAVPLEVVFYAETPAFDQYVEEEKAVFSRLFSSIDPSQSIIQVRKTHDYHALRDYCHLPADTKLPHTLVFMIDGYWGTTRKGSLRQLNTYLTQPIESRRQGSPTAFEDVFELFRSTRAEGHQHRAKVKGDFFPNSKYLRDYLNNRTPEREVSALTDRVPFMWDYGFLLCDKESWANAASAVLPEAGDSVGRIWESMVRIDTTADDISLMRQNPAHPPIQWRTFFEACSVVAAVEKVRSGRDVAAFDFFTGGFDSLLALFFEIWFSELARDANAISQAIGVVEPAVESLPEVVREEINSALKHSKTWLEHVQSLLRTISTYEADLELPFLQNILVDITAPRNAITPQEAILKQHADAVANFKKLSPPPADISRDVTDSARQLWLQSQFKGCSLQWYKSWLLLIEVLDLRQYFSPESPLEFRPRDPSFEAIASRHWYRTACAVSKSSLSNGVRRASIPARLPGHFSLRGTWCLAVAAGSRSYRLADRALDILSSRRANRTRLHRGLGLPARDVFDESADVYNRTERVRVLTGLSVATRDAVHHVSYADLLELGARHSSDFHWLFRSRFREYDRQARVIRRWMNRIFNWSVQYRYDQRRNWMSGYRMYDELARGDLSSVKSFPSFEEHIPRFLDAFVDDLNRASDADEHSATGGPVAETSRLGQR